MLDADGIPLVGKIDLIHARGVFISGDERGDVIELPNTVEVIDHKFVGSFDRNLSPPELARDLQMAGYAEYVFRRVPAAERVRLSHNYFHTKANTLAVKVSTVVTRDQAVASWAKAHRLARMLKDVVAFRGDSNQIDANPRACSAYGGCPHGVAGYCTAYGSNSLTTMFGAAGAALLGGAGASGVRLPVIPASTATQLPANEEHMQPPIPSPAAPPMTPLAAQFMATMQSAAAAPPPPTAPTEPQGFREAVVIIDGAGWGWPALEGEAAYWRGVLLGYHTTGVAFDKFPATGALAAPPPPNTPPRLPLATAAQVIALAQEMHRARQATAAAAQPVVQQPAPAPAPVAPPQLVMTQQPPIAPPGYTQPTVPAAIAPAPAAAPQFVPPPALLPPEAPASSPALAATPMALPFALQGQQPPPAPAPVPAPIVQPPAPPIDPSAAAAQGQAATSLAATSSTPAAGGADATPDPKAAKKAAAAAKKAAKAAGASAPVTVLVPLPESGIATPGVAHVDGFEFYVDCVPVGQAAEDFQPKLALIAAGVLAQFGGGVDIRASSSDRLTFGKWRGELAAAIATAVATPGMIPSGVYVLDTRGSDFAQIAAEALAGYPGARGLR